LRNDYELENEFIKNIKSYSNKIQSRELFSKIKKDDIRCILCIIYQLESGYNGISEAAYRIIIEEKIY
jgi:hypothetical protein